MSTAKPFMDTAIPALQRNATDTLPPLPLFPPSPLFCTIDIAPAVRHSRRERRPVPIRYSRRPGIISRPSLVPRPLERYQVNVNCAMNLRGSIYSRGSRVTLADLVRSSSDTPDRSRTVRRNRLPSARFRFKSHRRTRRARLIWVSRRRGGFRQGVRPPDPAVNNFVTRGTNTRVH